MEALYGGTEETVEVLELMVLTFWWGSGEIHKQICDMCYEEIKTVEWKRGWLWPPYSEWSELASEDVTIEPDNLKDEKA